MGSQRVRRELATEQQQHYTVPQKASTTTSGPRKPHRCQARWEQGQGQGTTVGKGDIWSKGKRVREKPRRLNNAKGGQRGTELQAWWPKRMNIVPEATGSYRGPTCKELHLHFQVAKLWCIKYASQVTEKEKRVMKCYHETAALHSSSNYWSLLETSAPKSPNCSSLKAS